MKCTFLPCFPQMIYLQFYHSINHYISYDLDTNVLNEITGEQNKIENELQFETTSTNEVDLSKPVLYNNCANPITLSYVNQNIKTDYTMTDTQNPITYNGKLLKRPTIGGVYGWPDEEPW